MVIESLELKNYKCFDDLRLDGLGSRVVIVGPNGCGKSTVLEAIAVLKEYTGTYDPDANIYSRSLPLANKHAPGWPAEFLLPIRAGYAEAIIKVSINLNDQEAQFTNGMHYVEVLVTIHKTGEVVTQSSHPGVVNIFRHFDPNSGVGVIDYITPNRSVPRQQVKTLSIDATGLDQQRKERIELSRSNTVQLKFNSIKQFIIAQQLGDLAATNSGNPQDSLTLLKEVFHHFFSPKSLLGFQQVDNEYQVVVKTPYGNHDIDLLSSGEKEIFSIFVNLFRIRKLPSVVLYDEPERHLNAGLEAKIIPAIDLLQTENQLWITTHGLELISSVPLDEIVALTPEVGRITTRRFDESSKINRVRLFEQLGAKTGLQLTARRVVFLEGKESHADKRIVERVIGGRLPGVVFVASGSSNTVLGSGARMNLLEEVTKDAKFLMVIDKDYRDEADSAKLQQKGGDSLFVLNCHEIENTLLLPEVLLTVLKQNGVESFDSPDQVTDALHISAKNMRDKFIFQLAHHKIEFPVRFAESDDDDLTPLQKAFDSMISKRRQRAEKAYSKETVAVALESATLKVDECLNSDDWLTYLPGKEILRAFRVSYLSDLKEERFKEQIVACLVDNRIEPDELKRLREFINPS